MCREPIDVILHTATGAGCVWPVVLVSLCSVFIWKNVRFHFLQDSFRLKNASVNWETCARSWDDELPLTCQKFSGIYDGKYSKRVRVLVKRSRCLLRAWSVMVTQLNGKCGDRSGRGALKAVKYGAEILCRKCVPVWAPVCSFCVLSLYSRCCNRDALQWGKDALRKKYKTIMYHVTPVWPSE